MTIKEVKADKLAIALTRLLPKKGDVHKMLRAVADSAREEWIAQASDALKTSSDSYIKGIQDPVINKDKNIATIRLVGVLPNMIEKGWGKHDLRKTILVESNRSVRTSKEGHKYAAVPFRHMGPKATGRNAPAMPGAVHSVARGLAGTVITPNTRVHGEHLVAGLRGPKTKFRTIMQTKMRPWHSGSIYEGMIRKVAASTQKAEAAGAKKRGGTYATFRMISEKTPEDSRSWMHPGITAKRLVNKVQTHVRTVASGIVKDAMR